MFFPVNRAFVLLFSGIEYVQAASSLAILAIALIPAMIANFYINIVMIPLKLEKKVMIATVTSAMINIVLNFILIPIYAENAAAFTTLIAEISMTVIAVLYCRNIKMVGLVKPIVSGLVGGAIIVCICWFLNHIIINPFINVALCVVLSGISYGAVMLLFYRSEVLSMVKTVLKRSKS